MERIGKFVVRDYGSSIDVFRIVGYDFDTKTCLMRPMREYLRPKFMVRKEIRDYQPLLNSDKLYSIKEAIDMVQQHIERYQNVVDIIFALTEKQTPRWLELERRENFKEEFNHLYPALQNITITLHNLRRHEDSPTYREYKKAFKHIRKRFYFYFGEPGKTAVDSFYDVAGATTASLPECKKNLAMKLSFTKGFLRDLEKYMQKYTPIEHP